MGMRIDDAVAACNVRASLPGRSRRDVSKMDGACGAVAPAVDRRERGL
jgi:hypothetical protein